MCRSIKRLRTYHEPATVQEFDEAALQFVRKISGFRKPAKANQDAFNRAVAEISLVSQRLLDELKVPARPVAR
ncbi:MAG: DUF2277 domain-containing protein [Dehalococcoidia bacterium]|nr:DUF2277 domain-containing protein [Dehalococcoidia bacterium]